MILCTSIPKPRIDDRLRLHLIGREFCRFYLSRGGDSAQLGWSAGRLMALLLAREGCFVSLDETVDFLWLDDADGGPLNVANSRNKLLVILRRFGWRFGFSISVNKGLGARLEVLPATMIAA